MKINKTALIAVAGAMLANSAFSQVTFHLFGSTAYRKATEVAIASLYGANVTKIQYDNGSSVLVTEAAPSGTGGTVESALQGSTNVIWQGTIPASFGANTVTIIANWAGSVGGIQSLADSTDLTPINFLAGPSATHPSSWNDYNPGTTVDIAMSDCDQISTPFDQSVDPSYAELTPTLVAVLEFTWAKGASGPANLTNVTPWNLQQLLTLGGLKVGQFTGNTPDDNSFVYLTGRTDDSGTRIEAEIDSFFGSFGNFGPLNQYMVSSGGVFSPFGAGPNFDGDGYSSGGSVKSALNNATQANYHYSNGTLNPGGLNSYIMGYISATDASGAFTAPSGQNTLATITGGLTSTSQWLSDNGVPFSEQAIREGAYTYFSYEHLFTLPSPPANTATLASILSAAQIAEAGNSEVPGTMKQSLMNIQHRADAALIIHN